MDTARPIRRPLPTTNPTIGPTLIRTPRDGSLFRGWGITL
jgi:hypothetical protein